MRIVIKGSFKTSMLALIETLSVSEGCNWKRFLNSPSLTGRVTISFETAFTHERIGLRLIDSIEILVEACTKFLGQDWPRVTG